MLPALVDARACRHLLAAYRIRHITFLLATPADVSLRFLPFARSTRLLTNKHTGDTCYFLPFAAFVGTLRQRRAAIYNPVFSAAAIQIPTYYPITTCYLFLTCGVILCHSETYRFLYTAAAFSLPTCLFNAIVRCHHGQAWLHIILLASHLDQAGDDILQRLTCLRYWPLLFAMPRCRAFRACSTRWCCGRLRATFSTQPGLLLLAWRGSTHLSCMCHTYLVAACVWYGFIGFAY